ncbi:MAG: hypothetical protein HQ567_03580, partial [Candidatus Nealsonbacteria bacterium]|nr:hypothetical protein [Candidatus Nealsonbacteria bacterium]
MNRLTWLVMLTVGFGLGTAAVAAEDSAATVDGQVWKVDVPGGAGNTVRIDAERGEFSLATRGNTDMWGARNGAPIAWSAAPEGDFAVEATVVYPTTNIKAVAGLCVYDGDGGKPEFTFGLDHWADPIIKLQGLPPMGNNPGVFVSRSGCREVRLRMECYRRSSDAKQAGARKTDAYLTYYRFDAKEKWTPLAALQRNAVNARIGLFLKTANPQSVKFSEVAVTSAVVTSGAEADLAKKLKTFQQIVSKSQPKPPRKPAPVFEVPALVEFKGHPAVDGKTLVFIARQQYRSDHHNTATMFQTGEINTGSFTGGSAIRTLEVGTGKVTTLLEVPDGVARDLEVSFDGKRLLFALRENIQDDYHLYELDLTKKASKDDSTRSFETSFALRQITFGSGISDIDPIYLPNGQIMFGSTREPKFCMCNRHIMCNLFTMDGDGSNIQQVGHSTLHEGHPALLPDGRVIYDRWEYVDRNFGDAQGVWVVNPDGTNHAIYWGNNTASPGAVLDSRAIPGTASPAAGDTGLFIGNFSSCHDRPWGALAIVDRRLGMDGRVPVLRTWPANAIDLVGKGNYDTFTRVNPKYEDPYPLSDRAFLCSRMTGQGEQTGIFLLDLAGSEILLYAETLGCYDPMPLAPRTKPPAIAPRMDLAKAEGYFYVANVYVGNG